MTDITVVDADSSHAERIAELEKRYIDCAWTAEQVRSETEKSNVVFLVALRGGTAIGYVSGEIAADEMELGNIAVDEAYRRQGVATKLFDALKTRAKGRGVNRIFLLVSADNAVASALYRAVGFTEKGVRRGYYGNSDAVIMELDI